MRNLLFQAAMFVPNADAWHLEHTATQDLVEGQKKPHTGKGSRSKRQMLWMYRGGIDQVRCLPCWELTIYPPSRHFKKMVFLFPRWDMLVSSLEGKYPWPKSKPTSSNTVYCLPFVSGHCWTTKYNTHTRNVRVWWNMFRLNTDFFRI